MADVDAAGGLGPLGAHGSSRADAHMDVPNRTAADSDVARQLMAMQTGGQVSSAAV
jgi:hypothetical protein